MWPPPLYWPPSNATFFMVRTQSPQVWTCSRFTYLSSALNRSQLDAAKTLFQSSVLTHFANCLSQDATIVEVQAYSGSAFLHNSCHLYPVGISGGIASPSLPAAFGACVQRYNAADGKRPYPRLTVPFVPESFVDPDRPAWMNATGRAAYETFAAAALAHLTFAGISAVPGFFPGDHRFTSILFNRSKIPPKWTYLHRRRERPAKRRVPVYPDIP